MAAPVYNIVIEQGTTWSLTITLKKPNGLPFSLEGYTGRCQIRKSYTDCHVLAAPSVEIPSPQKDGKIVLRLTKEQTHVMPDTSGVYDVEVESPTHEVARLVQGSVKISPEVTR